MNRIGLGALALWLAALAAPAEAGGGPFVTRVGASSATITWLKSGAGKLRTEKVALSGLESGKPFDYRVGDGVGMAGRFRTAPEGDVAFRFIVYGDTRSRADVHGRAVAAMAARDPEFVIHTGDMVDDGAEASQWAEFLAIEQPLLRKAAIFPVMGNHDRGANHYAELFGAGRTRYAFRWGAVFFAVIDSELGSSPVPAGEREARWQEELVWLDEELARNQSARFRFVAVHRSPVTALAKRKERAEELAAGLLPILEKNRVSALFSAHDHSYQRHEKGGVAYIVTAGAGAPLYDLDAPIAGVTKKAISKDNYVLVEVEGDEARIQAFDLDGGVLDSITLKSWR